MNIDRIINLLASGLKPAQVASIIGVTPARISQLTTTEEFKQKLEIKRAEIEKGDIESIALDAKYHNAEHALVDQVIQLASIAELKDATAALRVIGERQDRRKQLVNPIPLQGNGLVLNQVIQLTLPSYAVPELAMTSRKEIIAIGEQNIAPMNSMNVTNLFKKIGEQNELQRITAKTERTPEEASTETEIVEPQAAFAF